MNEPRIPYGDVAPGVVRAMLALSGHVRKASGLELHLLHLVDLRVSQINGCAFCVDMHTKELIADGETPERLSLLVVWHEAPCFTPRERAALAWAEALTRLGPDGISDEAYASARREFGDAPLVELTLAITTINAWNRFGVAFRPALGSFKAPPR